MIVNNVLGIAMDGVGYGSLYMIYALVMIILGIAVVIRRLHDVGKSGWAILITLIPFVGSIWFLVLMTSDGNSGNNEYGEDPKR